MDLITAISMAFKGQEGSVGAYKVVRDSLTNSMFWVVRDKLLIAYFHPDRKFLNIRCLTTLSILIIKGYKVTETHLTLANFLHKSSPWT